MDSTEAANRANIKTARLTGWLLALTVGLFVLTIISVCLMAWPLLYPPSVPSQVPPTNSGGTFMLKGWTPVIALGSCLVLSAISLLIVNFRTRNNKQLIKENGNLNSELTSEKEKAANAIASVDGLKQEAHSASQRAKEESNSKDSICVLFKECERELNDLKWLKTMVDEQAEDIAEHVVIKSIHPGSLVIEKSPRCVTLALVIRNESLFDITIHAKDITGRFFFNTRPLKDPVEALIDTGRLPIENLRPMQQQSLTLLQPLLKTEAETIDEATADSNARFWLGNLSIPISVENVPQQVETKNLRIRVEVEYALLSEFHRE